MNAPNRYLLLDRVAVGGMAEVYRAKSVGIAGFEKLVAIKRVLPALAEDDEFAEMFVEEAKIAGQLQHANIAAIFELGKLDDRHFIAMEYVFGKNVRQILDAQREAGTTVPPALAAWIGSQILAGLDYAHRKRDARGRPLGIIHRDVSPPNIIVSYEGLVKIVDFGIAKAASRATQTVAGVIKGKLAYMSPEQLMGQTLDHRSDVFAAAAVLHELLTSKRLFGGSNDLEVAEKVRDAEAEPPSHLNPAISPEIDAVVMRGLARERDERWPTAGEMQEALVAAVARPGAAFGTPALSAWMEENFSADHAREQARLERISSVSQPGVKLDDDDDDELVPFGSEDDLDGDATVISAPPREMLEALMAEAEMSSLVMVEDGIDSFDELPDSLDIELDDLISEPVEPVEPLAPYPPSPGEPPPSQLPTELSEPPAADTVRPPSVRFATADAGPASEPEPERRGVSCLGLIGVAILALALGVGGVVAWLYFSGRGLPFELPF